MQLQTRPAVPIQIRVDSDCRTIGLNHPRYITFRLSFTADSTTSSTPNGPERDNYKQEFLTFVGGKLLILNWEYFRSRGEEILIFFKQTPGFYKRRASSLKYGGQNVYVTTHLRGA